MVRPNFATWLCLAYLSLATAFALFDLKRRAVDDFSSYGCSGAVPLRDAIALADAIDSDVSARIIAIGLGIVLLAASLLWQARPSGAATSSADGRRRS